MKIKKKLTFALPALSVLTLAAGGAWFAYDSGNTKAYVEPYPEQYEYCRENDAEYKLIGAVPDPNNPNWCKEVLSDNTAIEQAIEKYYTNMPEWAKPALDAESHYSRHLDSYVSPYEYVWAISAM